MTWKPRRVFVPFQFQYKEKRKQQAIMDAKDYQEHALRTMANQQKILDRLVDLGPLAMQLDNGARGLADDAGEVSGVIKKHIEYGQALDIDHLKEELGDCFWRMLQICKAAGITFEECFRANYDKLNKVRYKDGYSEEAAKEENRDRAAERKVIETKDPYTQTGAGWEEPTEDVEENLPSVVRVTVENGEAKIGDSVPTRSLNPLDPFILARRIADTYIEGQNQTRAMVEIDRAEQEFKNRMEAMMQSYEAICQPMPKETKNVTNSRTTSQL